MVYKELDLTGSNLSNYKITEKLGRGGMATVYKAHELSLNRIVALKVLSSKLSDDEEFIKRFQREAQAAAKLNHPNIVQIYAIGEEKGIHFFAMEYIKGNSLSEILQEKKIFTPGMAVSLIKQVANGLSVAHKEGLVHRDIKPSNILIDKNDNAKIADFGIAFVQDAKTKLTREGSIIGTPEYLSPEQCEGKQLDGRSDIYSLGVTFYELLTGKTPYEADTPVSMIMKIVKGEFPPINEVNPDVPKNIQDIVEKMMNTNLAERYENAYKLFEDLESFEQDNLIENGEKKVITNVMDKKDLSEVVDNYKENKGSGKKAFLFIASILIVLIGIAIAAKFLYFDKQNEKSPKIETADNVAEKSEITAKNKPSVDKNLVNKEKKEENSENNDITRPDNDETKTGIHEDESRVVSKDENKNNKSQNNDVKTTDSYENEKMVVSKDNTQNIANQNDIEKKTNPEKKNNDTIKSETQNIDVTKEIQSGVKNKNIKKKIANTETNNTGNTKDNQLKTENKNIEKEKNVNKEVKIVKKPNSLPPENSFVISLGGNNSNVELVSSYIQNKLQKKRYIIIDSIATAGKPINNIARFHMIIAVNNLGTNTLKYYGTETTEYTVNISVKVLSSVNGRIVKGPINKTVRYTNLNVDENFGEAVDKIINSLNL